MCGLLQRVFKGGQLPPIYLALKVNSLVGRLVPIFGVNFDVGIFRDARPSVESVGNVARTWDLRNPLSRTQFTKLWCWVVPLIAILVSSCF